MTPLPCSCQRITHRGWPDLAAGSEIAKAGLNEGSTKQGKLVAHLCGLRKHALAKLSFRKKSHPTDLRRNPGVNNLLIRIYYSNLY